MGQHHIAHKKSKQAPLLQLSVLLLLATSDVWGFLVASPPRASNHRGQGPFHSIINNNSNKKRCHYFQLQDLQHLHHLQQQDFRWNKVRHAAPAPTGIMEQQVYNGLVVRLWRFFKNFDPVAFMNQSTNIPLVFLSFATGVLDVTIHFWQHALYCAVPGALMGIIFYLSLSIFLKIFGTKACRSYILIPIFRVVEFFKLVTYFLGYPFHFMESIFYRITLTWPKYLVQKLPESAFQVKCNNMLNYFENAIGVFQKQKQEQGKALSDIYETREEFNLGHAVPYLAFWGPIMEELIFRLFLMSLLKWLFTQPLTRRASTMPMFFGYSPWVMLSSLIFGASHSSNHQYIIAQDLNTNTTESIKNAIETFSGVAIQCTAAFLFSSRVLSPLFEKYGIAASIGAHCTWNTLSPLFGVLIAVIFHVIVE